MNNDFEVESFYKSVNCDCKAIIYIEHNRTVRFVKGSTLVLDRIYPAADEKGDEKARSLLLDTLFFEQVDTKNSGELNVIEDFKVLNIQYATMVLTGKDNVKPDMFWEKIF